MRCTAILGSGDRCGREARAGAHLCAFHRSIELRRDAYAFYLARLSAEDQEALPVAAQVEGVDDEIAMVRVLMRRVAGADELDAFRRGLDTLCRMLQYKHELERRGADRLHGTLEAVLERLGREDTPSPQRSPRGRGEEEPDAEDELRLDEPGLPSPPPSPAAAGEGACLPPAPAAESSIDAPRELEPARWATTRGRDESRPYIGAGQPDSPAGSGLPEREIEAAELVSRYQGGEGEALERLYDLLEVAILAVLLHYRASQRPSAWRWEDLVEESRMLLGELARQWRPGVSFLGYFYRAFPSAMARYARQAQLRATADPEPPTARGPSPQRPHPSPLPKGEGGRGGGLYRAEDLASLPELERQIVVLRAFEGQDMAGIARQLGVGYAYTYRLYERARARLEGRERQEDGGASIAMRRLVQALHSAAGPEGRLAGRGWAMGASGVKRLEYEQLMGRLEGAGAIRGCGPRQAGYLVERTAAATLARVGISD